MASSDIDQAREDPRESRLDQAGPLARTAGYAALIMAVWCADRLTGGVRRAKRAIGSAVDAGEQALNAVGTVPPRPEEPDDTFVLAGTTGEGYFVQNSAGAGEALAGTTNGPLTPGQLAVTIEDITSTKPPAEEM